MCIRFELGFYKLLFLNNNRYFEKFWFEILKNDAHNGDWKQYTTEVHPRFGHRIIAGSMIVKFNSKKDVQAEGIFHLPKVHWLTNPNNSLHVHVDTSWSCCHKALRWTETLNTGIENPNEPGPSTPKVYHQQLPHVDS